jgi:hypothetical protein
VVVAPRIGRRAGLGVLVPLARFGRVEKAPIFQSGKRRAVSLAELAKLAQELYRVRWGDEKEEEGEGATSDKSTGVRQQQAAAGSNRQ